jgi:hypothetical protein
MKNITKTAPATAALAAMVLLGLSTTSKALVTLTDGSNNIPGSSFTTILGTQISPTLTEVINIPAANGQLAVAGTLYESVYSEGAGVLDFYYRINITSGTLLDGAEMTFGINPGYGVAVGYYTGSYSSTGDAVFVTPPAPNTAPSGFSRSTLGNNVDIIYSGGVVGPGSSYAVDIQTTGAPLVSTGGQAILSSNGGASQTITGLYEPIPEPTTALFGVALLGGVVLVSRKRQTGGLQLSPI